MTEAVNRRRLRHLLYISVAAFLLYCIMLEGSLLPLIKRVVSGLLSLDGNAGVL